MTADPTVRFQCTYCGALNNRHVVHLLEPVPEGRGTVRGGSRCICGREYGWLVAIDRGQVLAVETDDW